ncbi:transglutaminase domain-containing protein [Caryophanon latum]|uniref:S-layer protein n=1 Tax=Caryophanon latum TaxID=33977 RepID=A0A1C0YPR9_9BACL|nr:transglutaminase domain-containing protein [Caryophanon latum]OCS89170.1 S-layer protein [Caryophanon latum]
MTIYFESLPAFQAAGGLKATTITAKQLLPAIVAHMQRMDRQFTLHVTGRLPTSMEALLDEAFALCHLQQPFYTQHCASRNMRYKVVSKNRIKIDFTLRYRMTRDEEKWVLTQIDTILARIITKQMTPLQKMIAVHDYIIRAYDYEMNTTGSPFTVYTFMHEKQGVCMAYALLFQKMMEAVDIPCHYVVGKADGESDLGHAWNMVELDGQWYHIDATWNDLGKRVQNLSIRYRYFLRSDDVFQRDHQWNLDHYPPCTNDRYAAMQSIYDAAIDGAHLYYPQKGTAHLMKMDVHTLQTTKIAPIRVQQCVMYDGQLYVHHVDEQALYTYIPATDEWTCVQQKNVQRITRTDSGVHVQFTNGDEWCVQHEQLQQEEVCDEADHRVLLERFGNSWFGEYKGAAGTIAFTDEAGLTVMLREQLKAVTIDVCAFDDVVTITLQNGRKPLNMTEPLDVTLPEELKGCRVKVNGEDLNIR